MGEARPSGRDAAVGAVAGNAARRGRYDIGRLAWRRLQGGMT